MQNFREELKSLRFATVPVTEEVIDDIFDKHVEAWHNGTSSEHIWVFLGLSLEEYSDLITKGDAVMIFFWKVCSEA